MYRWTITCLCCVVWCISWCARVLGRVDPWKLGDAAIRPSMVLGCLVPYSGARWRSYWLLLAFLWTSFSLFFSSAVCRQPISCNRLEKIIARFRQCNPIYHRAG
ncbi:uncharacterized protein B0H64DRAFT_400226 [Chaetomium fimeti]|uniref:Secreted protein n=1 Tax=Chaetomium fimeti TaxID=1854472 RepID=A0AAE0HDB6_9PEZI|nr:hypothetical protein B0H64DRAFT_400226 [Chaetomium fimeti]